MSRAHLFVALRRWLDAPYVRQCTVPDREITAAPLLPTAEAASMRNSRAQPNGSSPQLCCMLLSSSDLLTHSGYSEDEKLLHFEHSALMRSQPLPAQAALSLALCSTLNLSTQQACARRMQLS